MPTGRSGTWSGQVRAEIRAGCVRGAPACEQPLGLAMTAAPRCHRGSRGATADHCASRSAAAASTAMQALLIHEAPGAGGEWLALWAAQLVLCQNPSPAAPCGSSRRLPAGRCSSQHPGPDMWVRADRKTRSQIRDRAGPGAFSAELAHHRSPRRRLQGCNPLAGRCPQSLRRQRASEDARGALAAHAAAWLVATQPSRLPATIRSRCQRLRVSAARRAQESPSAWLHRRDARGRRLERGPRGARRGADARRAGGRRARSLAQLRRADPRRTRGLELYRRAAPIRWPRPSAGRERICRCACCALRIGSQNASAAPSATGHFFWNCGLAPTCQEAVHS